MRFGEVMNQPRPESSHSNDRSGRDSASRHDRFEDETSTVSVDTTRLGAGACILFMVGGLYWTASVGLLTLSALTAYPLMISVGFVLTLVIFGATFWTPRASQPANRLYTHSQESNFIGRHTYDSVTGLPTQRLFTALLNQALSRAQAHGRQVAVIMIEMDHFTPQIDASAQVNESLIYRVQAARVKSALRSTDTLARLAERTFVVLLDHVIGPEEALTIAKKMQATIALPVTLDAHELFFTSRMGIGVSGHDAVESGPLLDAATRAVAAARAEGYAIYGWHDALTSSSLDSASTLAA